LQVVVVVLHIALRAVTLLVLVVLIAYFQLLHLQVVATVRNIMEVLHLVLTTQEVLVVQEAVLEELTIPMPQVVLGLLVQYKETTAVLASVEFITVQAVAVVLARLAVLAVVQLLETVVQELPYL
jgi:hypothetical protein